MAHHHRKDPLVWGIILIVVGAIFFLENFNIDVWNTVWRLWPVILIVWGALKLYNGLQERKEKPAEKKVSEAPQDKP
jgi:uncharacterized membrane protein HdeD (DUF308 family)